MKKTIFFLVLFLLQQLDAGKHFVLISVPGSGKGTFSQHLTRKGYIQICPGDIFRDEVITPMQSKGLNGYEQSQRLPG